MSAVSMTWTRRWRDSGSALEPDRYRWNRWPHAASVAPFCGKCQGIPQHRALRHFSGEPSLMSEREFQAEVMALARVVSVSKGVIYVHSSKRRARDLSLLLRHGAKPASAQGTPAVKPAVPNKVGSRACLISTDPILRENPSVLVCRLKPGQGNNVGSSTWVGTILMGRTPHFPIATDNSLVQL